MTNKVTLSPIEAVDEYFDMLIKSKFIKNWYTVCILITGFNFLIDGYFKFYIL